MRVRPTKIELIRLKKRLGTSVRVRRILSERLTVLVNEFMSTLKECVLRRDNLQKQVIDVYRRGEIMLGTYGPSLVEYLRSNVSKPRIFIGTENIMGVKIKTFITKYDEKQHAYPLAIDDFVKLSKEFTSLVLDLAKLEYALRELGHEINVTKRKSNALEYVIIPKLRSTIRYLQLKFDEREREEKARFKRIKQVLTKRRST